MSLFTQALVRQNTNRPPVWFMRQAGRYHSHYQRLRQKASFLEICKVPELAAEATLGPIEDFDFDAAILFSDLLFPLEVMGFGLTYPVGPQLSFFLRSENELTALHAGKHLAEQLLFQKEALLKIQQRLKQHQQTTHGAPKGLIGFVGGPWTLFCYAVDGSHKNGLIHSKQALKEGLFEGFCKKLFDILLQNMLDQASTGIDCLAMMDTCAGDIEATVYQSAVIPVLQDLFQAFREKTTVPLLYYSKGTSFAHWKHLEPLALNGIGVDWHTPMAAVLEAYHDRFAIQGNFSPLDMLLTGEDFQRALEHFFEPILALPSAYHKGWIAGLGHGILPATPESNVRTFLAYQRKLFLA